MKKFFLLLILIGFTAIQAFSQTITLTSPNGGEQWTSGSSQAITWSSFGNITDVNIFYSVNNGGSYSLVAAFQPNNGSYIWTIPSVNSFQCKVKVVDFNNTNTADSSDAVFTISPPPANNYALQFSSTKYVAVSDAPAFDIDSDFTIETWIKTSGSGQQGVITQGVANNTGYGLFTLSGSLYFQYYSGGSFNNGSTALGVSAGLNNNNWHHIAVVINGANGKLYVDGQIVQQKNTLKAVDESSSIIHFGYHPNVGQFNGQLDEIRFWNTARTQAEIQNNMGICLTGPQQGLAAAYNFNDGPNSSVLTDYSGNGNNGTLTNMNVSSDWVLSGITCSAPQNSIAITAPNGGENWQVGSAYNISWNTTGTINQINLFYSYNGGTAWNIIADSLNNSGSYNWTVPNYPSANCRVKIVDADNPTTVFDSSNADFTISPATVVNDSDFVLTSPNGGEAWIALVNHTIYWVSDSVSNYVNLEYSTNNGNTWKTIIAGTYNYGYYNWLVPEDISVNCKIKITDYNDSAKSDVSDAVFSILPAPSTITVSAPNNGETWAVNSTQNIYWSTQYVDSVKIEYTINNGSTWNTVVAATGAASGYYSWIIPNTPSALCKVRVSKVGSPSVFDISDNVFKIVIPSIIVISPNGGENWTGNSYQNISWVSSGLSAYVKIDYSINNGSTWINITNGLGNSGSYSWYVPNNPSSQCLVKISDYYTSSIFDSSNADFTISSPNPSVSVTVPNGGEQWVTGSSQYIYWNATNSVNVKIEYSLNNGLNWNTIIASTPASNGFYYWSPIPGTASTQCLIRVSDVNQNQFNDVSNNTFSILNPFITVTSPNGGETFLIGVNSNIYWNYGGTSNYVTLEYSTNGGSVWNTIVAGANNNGSYAWTVPNTPSLTCKMRISDYYDTTITDISDNNFNIGNGTSGSVTVNVPNGGEQWNAGSGNNIYWTSDLVDTVNIYFSTNNGFSYNLIAAGVPASVGYYYWNPIPATPSNQCKVKVVNAANASIFDASNNPFKIIIPSYTVTSPNGGEVFTGGNNNYIYWNSQGVSNYVKIEYSINNGGNWTNIINGAGNSGSYYWNVPNTPSNQCLVKVMDYYDNTIVDSSNSVFTINPAVPIISVNLPNGGENVLVGSNYNITWSSTFVDSVKIEYSINNGSLWNLISPAALASNNYYSWLNVPNTPSGQCLIKISQVSDSSYFDVSNYPFSIIQPFLLVTTPNGGETWTGNSYKNIYWTGATLSGYVKLDYSVNGGDTWNPIVNGAQNNNQYQWYVPDSPSVNCLIKISDYNDTTIKDVSDAFFTINSPQPTIAVTSPNGGQTWGAGSSQYIYWNSTYINNIKLEFSPNNGASWTTIISSIPAANGYYNWVVPNSISNFCKIRVSDSGNPSVNDISDNVFSIFSPGITITTPNGGEQWQGGTGQYIYWTSAGLSNYVIIDYSMNGGSTWVNLTGATGNTGYYLWTLPNSPSDSCLIKITDYYTSSLSDVSDSLFSINYSIPTLTLTSPLGGEQWGTGSGQYITWTSSNITNVKIEYSTNAGAAWTTLSASTPAANGYYYWAIPNTPSPSCYVKVSDASNLLLTDSSDFEFTIIAPVITLTQPNGGQQWIAGTSQNVTWTTSGASGYVNIFYSVDSGNTWAWISNGAANNGVFPWTIPNYPSAKCLVKISDYYNSTVADTGNGLFTILPPPPALTLTNPAGGEVYSVGSIQTIYWSATSINFVKLEYSYNGGSSWNVVISSTPAGNGSYNWPIPNTPTSSALVRVSDASNPGLNDVNNTPFSIIIPSVTVTTPNGGESWTGLTAQYIYWNSTGISNYVTIEYSTNNGASWNMVANGTGNNGYYYWTVPNTPSINCRVRVKDYYNNNVLDISNNAFSILVAPASIVVNSPNGSEAWGVGTTQNISWTSSAVTDVIIEYSANGGTSWNLISGNTPASNGYFSWTVPNNPSSNCLVRVTDFSNGNISDQSNNEFSIVNPAITITTPDGGEMWTAGNTYSINWTSLGISNYVKIQYSVDSGGSWINIATSAYNNGSYQWNVPNTPSSKCIVKIFDYYNAGVYDSGNSVFTIVSPPPSITLTSPNGGETWVVGNTYYIQWSSSGITNVKLEYSINGGTSWSTIIASAINNGSYNWPVPNAPSATCLIKVSDVSNPGTNDISNNTFSITAPFISITQPNGGEVLQSGNGYYITWTSAGVSYVKIEYSIDDGANWITVVSSVYNNGYYHWNVPNNPSAICLVRVSSTANPLLVNDQSNNVFSINPPLPSVTLNSPNNGEYWYVGYQHYITWTSSAVNNVKLEYSTNGGLNWNVIIATTPANSGFYFWPVPNSPSANCKIKISDASNMASNDSSSGLFTIAIPVPSITLNNPNGSESWTEGSYQYITWTKNFVNSVNVEYSIDSGASWILLASNLSSNYYYWNIPGSPTNICLVKATSVSDTAIFDMSDAVFTLKAFVPNTNTIGVDSISPLPFCKEDTFYIYYKATGVYNAGNVFTAQLSDSSGNFFSPLAIGSVQDTVSGFIPCLVPSYILNADGYRVRVVASDLPTTGTNNGIDIIINSPEFDFASTETIKYLPDGNVQLSFIGDTSGIISYLWSMGNGDSSTVMEPSYSYSEIGYFTVDLTVTDNNGCQINLSKYNYMRIEQLLPNTQLTTNTSVDLTAVYFSDITTGIMTMADGNCLITLDSGVTWNNSLTGLGGYAASVSMQPGYWFITGVNGSIVFSTDSGLTWQPMYTGTQETFNGSSFSAPDFGFSVGTNGVIYNYDGIKWTAQTSTISENLNSVFTLGNLAYSAGDSGKIIFYDGSSWSAQTTPVTTNLNSVFFTGTSTGLAVGDNGYILNYDGNNWNVSLSGVDVNFSSVTASGDSAWAVANNGIIYWSDDGGLSWMRYSVGTTTDLSGITYIKSGGKAASSSKGYIGGKGGEGRMIGSDGAEEITTTIMKTIAAKNNFILYPNPANGFIFIEIFLEKTESVSIQLRDVNGNLVKTIKENEAFGFYQNRLEVSKCARGVYFVHVLQGDKFFVKKVVVE